MSSRNIDDIDILRNKKGRIWIVFVTPIQPSSFVMYYHEETCYSL